MEDLIPGGKGKPLDIKHFQEKAVDYNLRIKYRSLILFFIMLSLCLSSTIYGAKSYQISEVKINAQLLKNGNMEIIESRTYSFSGEFSYVFRVIPTMETVSFKNFAVSEEGRAFRQSSDGAPGTYRITQTPGQIEVRWFFSARDEQRTFDFGFTAVDAVKCYEDAAVLYFQFISRDWDRASYNLMLHVRPPHPLSRESVNEWLHAPLWAESRIEIDGTITAWCERLPERTFFEVRALYLPDAFEEAPMKGGRVRSAIIEEEAIWAEEANRIRLAARQKAETKKRMSNNGRWIMILLSAVGILIFWKLFQKYGRRPKLSEQPKLSSDIPQKLPPALVGYLLGHREIYATSLVATILDLALRGFLKVREEREMKKKFFGGTKESIQYSLDLNREFLDRNPKKLQAFEMELLSFLFDEITDGGDTLDFQELKKQQSKFMKFFARWKKGVKEIGKDQDWFDLQSIRGMTYSILLGAVMIVLSGVSAFLFGPWAIILAVTAVVVFSLSFFIPHRSEKGERMVRQWKALKNYLKNYHFRFEEGSNLLSRISGYFVYGIVLGLNEKDFKELAVNIPPESSAHYFPWYVFHGRGAGTFSPEAFASAFSTMIATTSSTMSTVSGTGGGASVGGGGGASSGGGGAG
jgi:uncharacterized membrane protein